MSCPTCSHTMQAIGYGMFHCPRCGTLKGCPVDGSVYLPALVGRCREFEKTPWDEAKMAGLWHTLGIHESINP